MMSVYGGTGFIGSRYASLYSEETTVIERSAVEPATNEVLYFISTVDNYNVFTNPHLDIDTNLTHLVKVLESCRERQDVTFNFVSSWFVYGRTNEMPVNEESECNPRGFYSITKRAAEQLLVSYCETFQLKYRILRLCNVYGPGDKKSSKKKNAMQHIVNEIVAGRDVNLYNDGENVRDFMHVDDVCRAIRTVCNSSLINEIVNIGTGKPTKILEVAKYAKEKTGSQSSFKSVKPPDFHRIVQVENMYLDVGKLSSLGFSPSVSLERGIDELIENARIV